MKRKLWIPIAAIVVAFVFTACLKNDEDVVQCTPNTLAQDQHVIDSFINANDIDYLTYNPSYAGYLGITNPGSLDSSKAAGDSLVAFKRVIRTFKGSQEITVGTDSIYHVNGTLLRFSNFKIGDSFYYLLTNARKGGSMRIVYPSSVNALGVWGCQSQALQSGGVIPAYSQVIFDITLTGVKN